MRAGYARVSTQDQSLSRQKMILNDHGNIDEIYTDKSTGTDTNRPRLQEVKSRIETGDIDAIVSTDMSRLARSVTDFLELVEFCEDHDVAIEFIEGSMPDYKPGEDDPTSELVRNIIAAVVQFFAEIQQQNIREGFEAKKARGEHVGPVPYGYKKGEAGELRINQNEYETARMYIREVKKGRAKRTTARFFGIESKYQSILENAEEYYDTDFDNDQWKIERAKVEAGEKDLNELE